METPDYAKQPEYEYFDRMGTRVMVPDIMMWVGDKYYTMESFLEEVRKQGLSKRLKGIPDALVYGETRLFLVHPSAVENPDYDPLWNPKTDPKEEAYKGKELAPGIFAITYIEKMEFILDKKNEKTMAKWEKLKAAGVHPISMEVVKSEPERGCGFRKPGALYMVTTYSAEDIKKISGEGVISHTEIKGGLSDIDPPIPFIKGKLWRGISWVDGDAIMDSLDESTWFLERKRIWLNSYYCTNCGHKHRLDNKIGKAHIEFKGDPPEGEEDVGEEA